MTLFASCLAELKKGHQANVPIYSFALHQRLPETTYLYGAAIIITEGIMTLQDPTLRSLYDLKVFVQYLILNIRCDSDLMLARRLKRDTTERGRTMEGVLEQYLRFVKPSYDSFVQPTSRFADIIVPGNDNHMAIDLITTHIRKMLNERSVAFRKGMADSQRRLMSIAPPSVDRMLTILPQTPQIKGMMTVLRDVTTPKADFIFNTDRLATTVIEAAMTLLPFEPIKVMTPIGVEAEGQRLAAPRVCGIQIMRSGGPLSKGLGRCIRDVELGAVLIQTDSSTGEPMMLHSSLPNSIRRRDRATGTWVFLLDAQIGTGATAMMAIRVLLDHGVPADHIIFVTFLVAKGGGIVTMQEAFPGIKVVTAAVDAKLKEGWVGDAKTGRKVWNVEPGMGHLGDRYY
ncbi:PRTase-like protein [Clavulina sp. PMI_390]|nr:PRTase-like protein [Clavulina sp. PMI_390]